jgi:hypothetical protein
LRYGHWTSEEGGISKLGEVQLKPSRPRLGWLSALGGRGLSGHVDRVQDGVILGWAWRRNNGSAIEVDVRADGVLLARSLMADIHRADLVEAGIGRGTHGFAVDMGDRPFPQVVEVLLPGTEVVIARRDFSAPAHQPDPARPETAGRDNLNKLLSAIRPEIDEELYLAQLTENEPHPEDVALHYVTVGWTQGLDPNETFSTAYYIDQNPDVVAAGVNPFWHFIVAGRNEKRLPKPPNDVVLPKLQKLRPLAQLREAWRRTDVAPASLSISELVKHQAVSDALSRDRLVFAIAHDDFQKVAGGVQLCVQIECDAALRLGYGSLVAIPWQSWPTLARVEDGATLLRLFAQGEEVGVVSAETMTALGAVRREGKCAVAIHSMLGHRVDDVAGICKAMSPEAVYFWLHDHFTQCESYSLQRNTVTFCGAPPPTSAACGICIYGPSRQAHLNEISRLFDSVEMTVVAPSTFQLGFWKEGTDYRMANALVHPHARLGDPIDSATTATPDEGPLRVAYLGWPQDYKGWPAFADLAKAATARQDIEFHYFGTASPSFPRLQIHPVSVTSRSPMAMTDALLAQGIDIVVHWAGSPETFSLSTYEALAADTLVVTGPVAGNIGELAKTEQRIRQFRTHDELHNVLLGGNLMHAALKRRAHRQPRQIVHGGLTCDLAFRRMQ